jgi:hypothetical protein
MLQIGFAVFPAREPGPRINAAAAALARDDSYAHTPIDAKAAHALIPDVHSW